MAPEFHPYRRQWLQNFIPIGVNGSKISSLWASMTPDFHPDWRQWIQIDITRYGKGSREDPANLLPTGAVDTNWDEDLDPLTPIGMKFWSH